MKAILLFSHGSVLCGSERNLFELAEAMREAGDAPIVEVGFLNYSEPQFAQAVETCVERGATTVIIVPWFLIGGKFVREELPGTIESARARHPRVRFIVADVIGFHSLLADAVTASAAGARAPEDWTRVKDSEKWCRASPRCPIYKQPGCAVSEEATA